MRQEGKQYFLWGLVAVLFVGGLLVGGWIFGVELREEQILQRFDQIQQKIWGQTLLYDDQDQRFASLSGAEKREIISRKQFSPDLVKAVLAIEDHRFYRHHGLDLIRIGGAALNALQNLQLREGASTITQQLVKLTLLSPEAQSVA